MDNPQRQTRGVDMSKAKIFTDSLEKEAHLRLKWFRKNEERLIAYTEKPSSRTVPTEILDNVKKDRQGRYQNVEKYPRSKTEDAPPPLVDPNAAFNVMKPVDPIVKKLLYAGTQKDGRLNYLKKRQQTIPEDKYYFPEKSSYYYGWNMWNSSKTATPIRYGRISVIQSSFYRRNGVGRDPDWYQEPEIITPCTCGVI